jgi:hypothetical protein
MLDEPLDDASPWAQLAWARQVVERHLRVWETRLRWRLAEVEKRVTAAGYVPPQTRDLGERVASVFEFVHEQGV